MAERVLIVNADDFGRSPGVNQGVIRGHEQGVVTSATLMVRWPAAEEAAAYARRSDLSVGLHLDLGEWVYGDGEWQESYRVVPETPEAVTAELDRQLERLKRLIGRPPTHLDSHQHVHRNEPARTALRQAGERLGIPVRWFAPGITYSGAFFGSDSRGTSLPNAITVEALVEVIEALPAGVTELACHPAAEHDHDSDYGEERIQELETLCDPRVREAIDRSGVDLRSFADLDQA
jgi:predicted glycoside hydrolase/deacetylase ChbG (UPF0249 family)